MAQQSRVGTVATTARTKDGILSVVYHQTEVVRANSEAVTLDSGGWRTSTTKTRMNQASRQYDLGYLVSANKGVWYVYRGETSVPFEDGMTFPRGRS